MARRTQKAVPMRLGITFSICFCIASIANGAMGFDESDAIKVGVLNQCEACDLREAEFMHANLKGGLLRGADLRQANLSGADLSEARLSRAKQRKANL